MRTEAHWAAEYVGQQLGPNKCWELVCTVQRRHYSREVPSFALVNPSDVAVVALKMERERTKAQWVRIPKPVDGCIAAMGHGKLIHHAGIFLSADGGVVLHSLNKKGVLCDTVSSLRAKHGLNLVQFYLHSTWPTS